MDENEYTCYYHSDLDGIASAAIFNIVHPNSKFIKMNYDDEIFLADIKDKKVAILDFSFSEKDMAMVLNNCQELIWCDHHKTAQEKNPNLWDHPEIIGIRDLKFAGCELTWQYLFPGSEIPDVIKLIADRDLWKFEFETTEPFNERFNDLVNSPTDSVWTMLLENEMAAQTFIRTVIIQGIALIDAKNKRIEKAFKNGFDAYIDKMKVRVVNTQNDVSELGHYCITQGYDIGFIWRQYSTKIACSLRSEGDIDVSIIASKFGGGGHKNASGVNFNNYEEMLKVFNK